MVTAPEERYPVGLGSNLLLAFFFSAKQKSVQQRRLLAIELVAKSGVASDAVC
jgi:hypothetical protein